MKTLVVDAAPAVRARVCVLLAEGGVTVVGEAATANVARRLVRASALDAVVLDVDLPDREGLALLEELRAHVPPMTLLVFTNALSYRRRCLVLGADAFLDKSTEFGALAATLLGARRRG